MPLEKFSRKLSDIYPAEVRHYLRGSNGAIFNASQIQYNPTTKLSI